MKYYKIVIPSLILTLLSWGIANACTSIAYSRTTGDYGAGTEAYSCTSVAPGNAVSNCGKSDCIAELTFRNQCGSIARKTDNYAFIVTAKGQSSSEAGNKAMAACGSDCKLVTTKCDSD